MAPGNLRSTVIPWKSKNHCAFSTVRTLILTVFYPPPDGGAIRQLDSTVTDRGTAGAQLAPVSTTCPKHAPPHPGDTSTTAFCKHHFQVDVCLPTDIETLGPPGGSWFPSDLLSLCWVLGLCIYLFLGQSLVLVVAVWLELSDSSVCASRTSSRRCGLRVWGFSLCWILLTNDRRCQLV